MKNLLEKYISKDYNEDCIRLVKDFPELKKHVKHLKKKINVDWVLFLDYVIGLFVLGLTLGLIESAYSGGLTFLEMFFAFSSILMIAIMIFHSSRDFPQEILISRKVQNYLKLLAYTRYILFLPNTEYPRNIFDEKDTLLLKAILCVDKKELKNPFNILKVKIYVLSFTSLTLLFVVVALKDSISNMICFIKSLNVSLFGENLSSIKDKYYYLLFHSTFLLIFYLVLSIEFIGKILLKIIKIMVILFIVLTLVLVSIITIAIIKFLPNFAYNSVIILIFIILFYSYCLSINTLCYIYLQIKAYQNLGKLKKLLQMQNEE